MSTDETCPICASTLWHLCAGKKVAISDGVGWENDSTMELLGLSEAEIGAGICPACFISIQLPRIDTRRLYGDAAVEVRAKHYTRQHPGAVYGASASEIGVGAAFRGAVHEYDRFTKISAELGRFANSAQFDQGRIKILDWGGGDGSVSIQYAAILKAVTGYQVDAWLFDSTTWKHGNEERRLTPETLRLQAPFDVVVLSHVIEHIDSPRDVIEQISGIIKDGGILILEVPDERVNIFRALLGRLTAFHYHVAWHTRRSLSCLLHACGLPHHRTFYQFKSSYHGAPMTAVLAIAQKITGDVAPTPPPSRLYETCNLALFVLRKIVQKGVGAFRMRR